MLAITLPSKLTRITFNGCASLSELVIPNAVTTIDERAFDGCKAMKKVTFGESITLQESDWATYFGNIIEMAE